MIYIFRMSRHTTCTHTFTVGTQIDFNKCTFLGAEIENSDGGLATGAANLDAELNFDSTNQIYMECDAFDENNIILNAKFNSSVPAINNLIPLGAIATADPLGPKTKRFMDGKGLVLIRHPTTWGADKQITITLREISRTGAVTTTPLGAAFGIATLTNEGSDYVNAGINLYFEFELTSDHNYNQSSFDPS